MSDFGSEVGGQAVQIGGTVALKALEAILALLSKIYDTWVSRDERSLNKEKLKELKEESRRREFVEKIDGSVGYVRHKKLKEAGIPLTSASMTMTKEEFKNLAAHCKREGILITGLVDSRELALNNRKLYAVECKQEDLASLAKIVDLMNDEKRIDFIDNKISSLESKDELTAQDEVDISELKKQRAEIQRSYCHSLNDEQAIGVIEKAATGESKAGMTFNAALNRNTGGHLDKDAECIVADAIDPSRHIKCHGHMDTYKGKPYIKTEYEVYNGGNKVYSTHDGRFDGRQKGYWDGEKAAMQQKGGMGDVVFKFYNYPEYEKYVEQYTKQNESELKHLDPKIEKKLSDYENACAALEAELSSFGAKIDDDGVVVYADTGQLFTFKDDMSDIEKLHRSEAQVIRRQIENYKDLNALTAERDIARSDVLTATKGSDNYKAAKARYDEIDGAYNKAVKMEQRLIKERKEVNAVKVEKGTRVGRNAQHDLSNAKSDDRRVERVTGLNDEKQKDLEEYKGKIEDLKKNQGAKGLDSKDRDVNKDNSTRKPKKER